MAITTAMRTQVTELYVSLFGRAPEADGLGYWVTRLGNGESVTKIAQEMYSAPASRTYYPSYLTNEEIVARFYTNVLGRTADSGGLAYWTGKLNATGATVGAVVIDLIQAVKTYSGTDAAGLTSQALFNNKVDAGLYYSVTLGGNSTTNTVLSSVTSTSTAHAAIDAIVNPPVVVTGQTFALTTGVEAPSSFAFTTAGDTFNADLSTAGANTLNTLDRLDGGAGIDTINVVLASDVTPTSMANIEVVNATATSAAARTLGLANAPQVTTVINASSANDLSVTGIAAGATLSINNVASHLTTFAYATTTGTQAAALSVNAVTGGAASTVTIAGIETITTTSEGASVYTLAADSATTLAFAGASTQTVTLDTATRSVTKYDASAATAAVTLTTIDQTSISSAATVVTVLGGTGSDVLTLVESNKLSVDAGPGNDTVTILAIDLDDTVSGGEGTSDTLKTNSAQANVLDAATPTTYTISGFENFYVTDTFDGTLITKNIDTGITKVTLGNGDTAGGGTTIATGGDAITGPAGSFAVDLGKSFAGNAAVLAGAMTYTDTGTAITDSLTVSNKAVNSTTATSLDGFGGQSLTSTGYENVTIATGTASNLLGQTIATLTITPDDLTAPVSLTVTGDNALAVTSLTTTTTGLATVTAAGMTAQSVGTTTFTLSGSSLGVGGTQSITGSGGDDVITVGAYKATMDGVNGSDTITGGSAADSISGGNGNDSITGGGGNDTILGGDGNDIITVSGTANNVDAGGGDDTVSLGATLNGDTVIGGLGTDILVLSAAVTAADASAVSGFETFKLDTTGQTQDMVQFVNNTGFTKITNGAGTNTFNNVYDSVVNFSATVAATTTTFDRLLDLSANSLTATFLTAATTTGFTALDEETITVKSSSTGAVTLTTLTVSDLTTLNVTGSGAFTITNAIVGAADLATLNASATTGTVNINASSSTVDMTVTGSATAASTIVGGSGNDVMTGGTGADSLTGGAGKDTINGGDGADVLLGGSGADSITGGEGADAITGGTGNDTIVLTETVAAIDNVIFDAAATNGVDTIVGFAKGTGVDTLTLLKGDTTVTTAGAAAVYEPIAAVTLVTAAAYDLTADNTLTSDLVDVYELTGTTASNGDLSLVSNGTELLKLLGTADSAATQITVDVIGDKFFMIAYDNGNAYIYQADSGADAAVTAAEITLVAVVTSCAVGAFTAGDILMSA